MVIEDTFYKMTLQLLEAQAVWKAFRVIKFRDVLRNKMKIVSVRSSRGKH